MNPSDTPLDASKSSNGEDERGKFVLHNNFMPPLVMAQPKIVQPSYLLNSARNQRSFPPMPPAADHPSNARHAAGVRFLNQHVESKNNQDDLEEQMLQLAIRESLKCMNNSFEDDQSCSAAAACSADDARAIDVCVIDPFAEIREKARATIMKAKADAFDNAFDNALAIAEADIREQNERAITRTNIRERNERAHAQLIQSLGLYDEEDEPLCENILKLIGNTTPNQLARFFVDREIDFDTEFTYDATPHYLTTKTFSVFSQFKNIKLTGVNLMNVTNIDELSFITLPPDVLKKIELVENCVDVSALGIYNNLWHVTFASCENLTSLNGISKLTSLEHLIIAECHNLIDYEDLNNCTELIMLEVSNSSIIDLKCLKNSKKLKEMEIMDCEKFISFDGISTCENLESILCANCENLTNVNDMQYCSKLNSICLDSCGETTDLTGISKLPNLCELSLDYNTVFANIDEINKCEKLHTLDLTGSEIHNFSEKINVVGLNIGQIIGLRENIKIRNFLTDDGMDKFRDNIMDV
jgi:hypothetical protein